MQFHIIFKEAIVSYISEIVALIRQAQSIASKYGFTNLLQPGLVKEMIIADILGHEVHRSKHEADAWDPADPSIKYEYLTCLEGGTFQLDRMFKSPPEKRAKSLERITRNTAVFCAVFYREKPLDVKKIYKIPIDKMLEEANRQLNASRNEISHIGYKIQWCEEHGEIVYQNNES